MIGFRVSGYPHHFEVYLPIPWYKASTVVIGVVMIQQGLEGSLGDCIGTALGKQQLLPSP